MSPVPLVDWGLRTAAGLAYRRRNGDQEGRQLPLRSPEPRPAHAGLWLDRGLAKEWSLRERGWAARGELYRVAVECLKPNLAEPGNESAVGTYRSAFRRYHGAVTQPRRGMAQEVLELETTSRLLLHTAAHETVTEGSLLLHHTYGVPYLPGSALKGAARARLVALAAGARRARRDELLQWADGLLGFVREGSAEPPVTSGSPGPAKSQAALVEFLDALWNPETSRGTPLAIDVVNPHHPKFYTVGEGERKPPTDGDNPVPVERLSVAPGARFLFVAETPQDLASWLSWLVHEVLLPALAEDGLGAWTSSGYGRLKALGEKGGIGRNGESAGWHRAEVTWNSGRVELIATMPDGRRAYARQEKARELLKVLSNVDQHALLESRRRTARLETAVEPEGTSWRIVSLRSISQ